MKTSIAAVLVSVALLTGCGASEVAAPVTVTETAPAVTVKAAPQTVTATAVPVTTTITVTVSAGNTSIDGLELMCATLTAAYDYVDAVEVNYWKKDNSAPYPFMLKISQEASDALSLIGDVYTDARSSDAGRGILLADSFGVANLKTGATEDLAVRAYANFRAAARDDCQTALG